jgi:hypothetical protein
MIMRIILDVLLWYYLEYFQIIKNTNIFIKIIVECSYFGHVRKHEQFYIILVITFVFSVRIK